ncbi:MAG: MBL fold metallo-hydrolase [Porphyromonadaceae bacterium]|nr:MBL fold metallo-hydrolase [Porphyromonadaceae bacterium]
MKLYKIQAGTFFADGGAVFGVVPKKVWQKRYPCNEENFCTLGMRCLVVKTPEKLILVDTGTGEKQLEYLKYYQFSGIVDFDKELRKIGYSADEVTDVILTHLHFDHCGTCTRRDENDELVLTFPNATHWVGKTQWENFLNPNVREGDSYFPENMLPVEEAGKLKLVENEMHICPEVKVKIFNGHTAGQLSPYVAVGDKTLVYTGDVIPLVANLPIAWVSSYDTQPIISMQDKERMLSEATKENQILFFEHDVHNECCTVLKVNGKYRVDEVFTLEELASKF